MCSIIEVRIIFFPWPNEHATLRGKIRSPEHCLKLERWQGPPHINKAEQREMLLSFMVSFFFFVFFLKTWKQDCLGMKTHSMKIFLFSLKVSSPGLNSAPLKFIIKTFYSKTFPSVKWVAHLTSSLCLSRDIFLLALACFLILPLTQRVMAIPPSLTFPSACAHTHTQSSLSSPSLPSAGGRWLLVNSAQCSPHQFNSHCSSNSTMALFLWGEGT